MKSQILTAALLVLVSEPSPVFATLRGFLKPKPLPPFPADFQGMGFTVQANLNFDATLPGNEEVIGVHLHTGANIVNGPIAVLFCGSSPLPSVNGACNISDAKNTTIDGQNRFTATFTASSSAGAWENGIANATAVHGAKTIASGAATTPFTFYETLANATTADSFVYINFHTKFSLQHNGGAPFGLARAQLMPVLCAEDVPTGSRCFGTIGTVSSEMTNVVSGLPAPFPPNAGSVTPVRRDVFFTDIMVVYTPQP
jgi:hypothetical protein